MFYKAGSCTSVENNRFIKFGLSAGTCSVDDFNVKIRVAVLQERQDWELPPIEVLKLVIPEHYTFMASNTVFIALAILDKYLKKATQIKSILPPGSYKTSLDTSSSPMLLSLHCKKINKVKNELDGQPSSLIAACTFLIIRQPFLP